MWEMIEKHVTNLELSKRLKELGVKQESVFYWYQGPEDGMSPWVLQKDEFEPAGAIASAFLSSELGELLPSEYIPIKKDNGQWLNCYEFGQGGHIEKFETEADARAKMLIYLIEQGLVKP